MKGALFASVGFNPDITEQLWTLERNISLFMIKEIKLGIDAPSYLRFLGREFPEWRICDDNQIILSKPGYFIKSTWTYDGLRRW